MSNNVWRYTVEHGNYGGIVVADSKEDAKEKVLSAYGDWYADLENLKENIEIWNAESDESYNECYPDVLEIY